jgi:tetratricopeptide (TPR) repeat protein
MSAAPRAQTDETQDDPASSGSSAHSQGSPAALAAAEAAAAADAEGWALLESLRRRLDEQANQQRKAQSDVRQLAESIGALVAEQRKRSLWINVNSFVAYVMFALLCGGAFYFMYRSRANELVRERDDANSAREEAVRRADEAIAKNTAREDADKKALEAYELLQQPDQRDLAAKKLAELSKAPLSKLDRLMLDSRAKQTDVLQVQSALGNAQAAFKAGRYADVVKPLEAALALASAPEEAAKMHYYLGVSYSKAGAFEQATSHLEAALAGDVDIEDARFHLASVLDRAGQWAKAKIEYDRFATAHPMSPHAAFAMRRGATLSRFPAVRPANAAAAAVVPAAPAAPATQTPPPGVPASVQKAPAPKAAAPAPKAPAQPATQEQQPAPKTLDFTDPSTE